MSLSCRACQGDDGTPPRHAEPGKRSLGSRLESPPFCHPDTEANPWVSEQAVHGEWVGSVETIITKVDVAHDMA